VSAQDERYREQRRPRPHPAIRRRDPLRLQRSGFGQESIARLAVDDEFSVGAHEHLGPNSAGRLTPIRLVQIECGWKARSRQVVYRSTNREIPDAHTGVAIQPHGIAESVGASATRPGGLAGYTTVGASSLAATLSRQRLLRQLYSVDLKF
jgi:hypothetical protein